VVDEKYELGIASTQKTESVRDYPRPPAIERCTRHLVVEYAGTVIASTRDSWRVLETEHPPTYYLPWHAVRQDLLQPSNHHTVCEFKGRAAYWTLQVGRNLSPDAAWSYPHPTPSFELIKDHIAFYPARVDACYVDGERVVAQGGDFYGGWITRDILGPFKSGIDRRVR